MKKIKFPKTKTASKAKLKTSLNRLEKNFGSPLPKEYVKFVEQHNGARPDDLIVVIKKKYEIGVSFFIPVRNILSTKKGIEGFPEEGFPIAGDDGGNYFYLNKLDSRIYFWDHEVEDGDVFLAKTFAEFLLKIKKFDKSKINFSDSDTIIVCCFF